MAASQSMSIPAGGLKVIIVGAGIAGLAASIALRRVGHEVTILERSEFKSEIGAAITITANGSRILESWGFNPEKAGAVECQRLLMLDGATLNVIAEDVFGSHEALYGSSIKQYHRVDLHRELRSLTESLGTRIELGSHVEDIRADGTVRVRNREDIRADLVVLADGIHVRSKACHKL